MRDVIFWGATGQAKILRDCMATESKRLVALFDDTEGLVTPFSDTPLFRGRAAFEQWLAARDPSEIGFLVAIGGEHGAARVQIHKYLESKGLTPLTAVHPRAFVAPTAVLGDGCQVLAQASIGVDARLGLACIVGTHASVEHEAVLGDGVHLYPGARIAGLSRIGDHVTVHMNAAILPRISVGDGAIIQPGSVVTGDVDVGAAVSGNPARRVVA